MAWLAWDERKSVESQCVAQSATFEVHSGLRSRGWNRSNSHQRGATSFQRGLMVQPPAPPSSARDGRTGIHPSWNSGIALPRRARSCSSWTRQNLIDASVSVLRLAAGVGRVTAWLEWPVGRVFSRSRLAAFINRLEMAAFRYPDLFGDAGITLDSAST